MKLQSLITQAFETFQEQSANARIVLLHPRSRYRSVIVARLINTPELNVFYYAMGPDDINLQSFISGVTHDIATQYPAFGRHTNSLPYEDLNNLDHVVPAFAQDLSEIGDKPFIFIIDEYDRCDSADDIQQFVERIITHLPPNCRIVINSRTLPRLPWVSLIAQKHAVLLQDNHLINDDFYGTRQRGKIKLDVFGLGPGHVEMNGEAIDSWEGHLPRLLFFFALDRPVITRSEICRAFWPELDMDQAVNVFHVTKRRLHKALNMDVLVHEGGYYQVNPELAINYDIIDYVSYLMAGRTATTKAEQLEAWQKATQLYRGPFLQGYSDPWIVSRRQDFQAGYLEALSEMAQMSIADDRPEQALNLIQKALNENPKHETLHQEIMRLYANMGRRSEAAVHYQRMVEDWRKDGLTPSSETEKLYSEIMT
ncbi:MAG: hypothetical protein D6737_11835 [Chloroflexi bacterium]|nr:MAG: hypothetical protein CUN54_00490 [Phototrophicales bacterium]RMF79332.1 MAG: hypothetical protein D6737_11835 [Chloroflexota bacterium]